MAGSIPPQAPGAPQGGAPDQQQQSGGARQLVSDIHSKLAELTSLIQNAAPESADEAQAVMASFQGLVDSLGQPAQPKAPQGPAPAAGPVPMEAGAAQVKPVM